jgi:hypothetical protein
MPRVNKRIKKQQINPLRQKIEKFIDYSSLIDDNSSVDFVEFYQNFMASNKKTNKTSKRYRYEPIKVHLNEPINNVDSSNCNDSKLLKLLEEEGLIMKQVNKKRAIFAFDDNFIL